MASIKEVANRAGVSISTVSNVINGTRYVSDELIQKVNRAIEELDYEVDLLARSLKNNRTMLIGVIITSLNRIFIPQVLNGLQKSAEEHGYHLLIHATNDDIKMEKKYLQYLVNTRVDGIVIDTVAAVDDEKYYRDLSMLRKGDKKIPVVCIERDLSKYGICSIYVDNVKGAYQATKHLVENGCEKIVHISGPKAAEMVLHRTMGYEMALKDSGLAVLSSNDVEGDFSPLSGYLSVKNLINDGIEFDGIFADNDQMAIGAIKAIKEYAIEVPGKVKMVGFDNTFVSSLVKPSLSTINVPKYRMGCMAAERLCQLMVPGKDVLEPDKLSVELMTNLLVRESTSGKKVENVDLEGW